MLRVSFSSFLLTCACACACMPSPEVCPADGQKIEPGALFGPCLEGGDCAEGRLCLSFGDGWVCAPTCNECAELSDVDLCASLLDASAECMVDGACVPSCDGACASGAVCVEQVCVWLH